MEQVKTLLFNLFIINQHVDQPDECGTVGIQVHDFNIFEIGIYIFFRHRHLYLTVDRQEMGERGGCDMQHRSSSRDANRGPLCMWQVLLTIQLSARHEIGSLNKDYSSLQHKPFCCTMHMYMCPTHVHGTTKWLVHVHVHVWDMHMHSSAQEGNSVCLGWINPRSNSREFEISVNRDILLVLVSLVASREVGLTRLASFLISHEVQIQQFSFQVSSIYTPSSFHLFPHDFLNDSILLPGCTAATTIQHHDSCIWHSDPLPAGWGSNRAAASQQRPGWCYYVNHETE